MQQRPGLGCTTVGTAVVVVGDMVSQGEAAIVEDLAQKHNVGESVVDGENDHGGQNALQDGAEDVEDISSEPDDDEDDRQSFGRAAAEVFNDLGRKHHHPTRDGDGATDARQSFNVERDALLRGKHGVDVSVCTYGRLVWAWRRRMSRC